MAPAPGPIPYAAWAAPAYTSWGGPIAAPVAHYAAPAPVAPWAVAGVRGYSVHTPTHSINFQI